MEGKGIRLKAVQPSVKPASDIFQIGLFDGPQTEKNLSLPGFIISGNRQKCLIFLRSEKTLYQTQYICVRTYAFLQIQADLHVGKGTGNIISGMREADVRLRNVPEIGLPERGDLDLI